MSNHTKEEWIWPEELDALVADPIHHRLLFENERVRILDTFIPPGAVTELHTHKWPSSLYIVSWSDFIRYDKDGNTVLDSRNIKSTSAAGSALWSEPLVPHVLKNIGAADIHIISVEIKH
jgi:quercetin dioxygenase-like cupin family protein